MIMTGIQMPKGRHAEGVQVKGRQAKEKGQNEMDMHKACRQRINVNGHRVDRQAKGMQANDVQVTDMKAKDTWQKAMDRHRADRHAEDTLSKKKGYTYRQRASRHMACRQMACRQAKDKRQPQNGMKAGKAKR